MQKIHKHKIVIPLISITLELIMEKVEIHL